MRTPHADQKLNQVGAAKRRHMKSLWPVYNEVSRLEVGGAERVKGIHEAFTRIMEEGLENYNGPPDVWHNIAMTAGRAGHREVSEKLILGGLNEWPDDVDLLCDELQIRETTHYDPAKAAKIWRKLETMDRHTTSPFWRFWVYGAIYHARTLHNTKVALALLDEGLLFVQRDYLMDILDAYRQVLIDSVPEKALSTRKDVERHQREALGVLEDRLRLGIALGVENGYVLATRLAQLYQERAGTDVNGNTDGRSSEYLTKALETLDLAEKLYTGDRNHPVSEIYRARIRILMAQRRYGEALRYLCSLPEPELNEDHDMNTMQRLASLMTGEDLRNRQARAGEGREEGDLKVVLRNLFANDGALLYSLATQEPEIGIVILNIASRLREAGDGGRTA